MDTLTIVKENKVNIEVPQKDAHKERVLRTIGKTKLLTKTKITSQQKRLKDAGFTFVGKDIEIKFAHKAGINGSYIEDSKLARLLDHPKYVFPIIGVISVVISCFIALGMSNWANVLVSIPIFMAISCLVFMIWCISPKNIVINYVGDLPEFVMDNMEKAQMAGVQKFMVYSCEPLPTEEVFAKVDPVMIGWLDDDNTGVVIGIWDRDKEVTI